MQGYGAHQILDAVSTVEASVRDAAGIVSDLKDKKKKEEEERYKLLRTSLVNARTDQQVAALEQSRQKFFSNDLPYDRDFEGYPKRLEEWKNTQASRITTDSSIDDETKGRLLTVELPNMANDMAVKVTQLQADGAKAEVDAIIKGKSDVLGTAPSLSLEEASTQYASFLAHTPYTEGTRSRMVETFRETYRPEKALQQVQREIDAGILSDDLDIEAALSRAAFDFGLRDDQVKTMSKNAYAYKKELDGKVDENISTTYDSWADVLFKAGEEGQVVDVSMIDSAFNEYPWRGRVQGTKLKNLALSQNDGIYAQKITDKIQKGDTLTDDDFALFSDSKTRDDVQTDILFSRAMTAFNKSGNPEDALNAVSTPEFTASSTVKQAAFVKSLAAIKAQLENKDDYEKLVLGFFEEGGTPQPVQAGTIDVSSLSVVKNDDGSVSTVRSISIEEDGLAVLIPTRVDGKDVSDEEAISHYQTTGQHLGKFSSVQEADAFHKSGESQVSVLSGMSKKNLNKAVDILSEVGATVSDPATLQTVKTMRADSTPQPKLTEYVWLAQQSGLLTTEDAETHATKYSFANNPNMDILFKIGEKAVAELTKTGGMYEGNLTLSSTVRDAIIEAVYEDPQVLTDSGKLENLKQQIADIARKGAMNTLLNTATSAAKQFADPDDFLKDVSAKGPAAFMQAAADGVYDFWLDKGITDSYAGSLAKTGYDREHVLDSISQKLFGRTYSELGTDFERVKVAVNTGFVMSRASYTRLFEKAFETSPKRVKIMGSQWAFELPNHDGVFAVLASYSDIVGQDGRASWSFVKGQRNDDGTYTLSPRSLTPLSVYLDPHLKDELIAKKERQNALIEARTHATVNLARGVQIYDPTGRAEAYIRAGFQEGFAMADKNLRDLAPQVTQLEKRYTGQVDAIMQSIDLFVGVN